MRDINVAFLTLIAKSSKHENAKQPHWAQGEKLVLGHPLAATIGDSARCMQNLEKVPIHGAKDLRHGDVYLRLGLTLIAKSSKHENAKQPHWAQARSSCWGTRSPPL